MKVTQLKLTIIGLIIWVFSSQVVYAAKTPIYIQTNTADAAGVNFAYAVREAIRRSSTMSLVNHKKDSKIFLDILTAPPPSEYSGLTFYSVVWALNNATMPSYYLNNYIGYCGIIVLDACANNIIAETDKVISFLSTY